jgi:NAD(P)-dependent dehydrogenase (short-subunit alcohol dehydrogenase family)
MLQAAINSARASYPSLADKRVLITGGATGIGEGLVEAFAAQGSRVAFVDVQDDAARALVERLGGSDAVLYSRCDLTDVDGLKACFAAIEDDRHKIDEITPAYWDDRMAVNLRHQFFASQAVIPAMRRAGGGAIVNFGSISWHLALPDLLLYQTAKAAIEGLTRSMARDLGRDGIRVNAVIPGNVQTPRQERWYTPEAEAELVAAQCLDGRIQPADVAALVLFLASDDARMCTGHEYFVDAGWR